jgi:hypothetical protein
MPGIKQKVAIALSAGALAAGLFGAFEPPSDTTDAQRGQAAQSQENADQAGHADDQAKEDYLHEGAAQADAETARRLTPGEYRLPELPDLRFVP